MFEWFVLLLCEMLLGELELVAPCAYVYLVFIDYHTKLPSIYTQEVGFPHVSRHLLRVLAVFARNGFGQAILILWSNTDTTLSMDDSSHN